MSLIQFDHKSGARCLCPSCRQGAAPQAVVAAEAVADAQAAVASSSAAGSASPGASGAGGGVSLVPFNDRDYELQVPADFTYLETPFEVRGERYKHIRSQR